MGIEAAQKCSSRTIVGYAMLLHNSSSFHDSRNNFNTHGDYSLNVDFESSIFKDRNIAKSENYQILACIVRHPVQRFISAYTDKLMHHPNNYNGKNNVSIDEFIEMYNDIPSSAPHHSSLNYANKLDLYIDIKYHITPLVQCYGNDASFYTHIFNTSQLPQIKQLIEQTANVTLPNLHLNQSIKHATPQLQTHQITWLLNTFNDDIDVYGRFM